MTDPYASKYSTPALRDDSQRRGSWAPGWRTVREDSSPETMITQRVKDIFTNGGCLVTCPQDKRAIVYRVLDQYDAEAYMSKVTSLAQGSAYMRGHWGRQNITGDPAFDPTFDSECPFGEVLLGEHSLTPSNSRDYPGDHEGLRCMGPDVQNRWLARLHVLTKTRLELKRVVDDLDQIMSALMGQGLGKVIYSKAFFGREWEANVEYLDYDIHIGRKVRR